MLNQTMCAAHTPDLYDSNLLSVETPREVIAFILCMLGAGCWVLDLMEKLSEVVT